MSKDPNSPKVVRDDTLRLATTHLAETAIGMARARLNKEIREITFSIIVMPVIGSALGIVFTAVIDQLWIGILALVTFCATPALAMLLLFKLKDRRQLNKRLIAEYELRRKYQRV